MKTIVAILFGASSALVARVFPDWGCVIGWSGCGLMIFVNSVIDEYRKNKIA